MNPRYLSSSVQAHLGSNSAWPVLAGRWHYLILSPKLYFVTPPRWQPSLQRALGSHAREALYHLSFTLSEFSVRKVGEADGEEAQEQGHRPRR